MNTAFEFFSSEYCKPSHERPISPIYTSNFPACASLPTHKLDRSLFKLDWSWASWMNINKGHFCKRFWNFWSWCSDIPHAWTLWKFQIEGSWVSCIQVENSRVLYELWNHSAHQFCIIFERCSSKQSIMILISKIYSLKLPDHDSHALCGKIG